MNAIWLLSQWASRHPWPARALILACYVLTGAMGAILACILPPSGLWVVLACILTVSAIAAYSRSAAGWRFRKLCHFALCVATLLFAVNNTWTLLSESAPYAAHAAIKGTVERENPVTIQTSTRHSKKLVDRLKALRDWYPHQSGATKALIVFGYIVLALAIAAVWAALCCSIACSGAEAIAVLLLLLGLAGITFGCILLIQKALHTGRWRRQPKAAKAGT